MSRLFPLTTMAFCAAMTCLPAEAEYSDKTDGSHASVVSAYGNVAVGYKQISGYLRFP